MMGVRPFRAARILCSPSYGGGHAAPLDEKELGRNSAGDVYRARAELFYPGTIAAHHFFMNWLETITLQQNTTRSAPSKGLRGKRFLSFTVRTSFPQSALWLLPGF
jgi:hypothetical protein